jgi:hypothetical protein
VSFRILAFAKKEIKTEKKEAKINPLDVAMRQVDMRTAALILGIGRMTEQPN